MRLNPVQSHVLDCVISGKSLREWERLFEQKVAAQCESSDPAHDLAHFRRVTTTAKALCEQEKAQMAVVLPAAWLHDLVNVPKNDPRRAQASQLSAQAALPYLRDVGYPEEFYSEIGHAIEAHSFSARIEARSKEAEIVQDADRLDGLGAIGIARVFLVGGMLKRPIYSPDDPFGEGGRALNDQAFTVDHFFVKLFKTAQTLRTEAGRAEGVRRATFMKGYLAEMAREMGVSLNH